MEEGLLYIALLATDSGETYRTIPTLFEKGLSVIVHFVDHPHAQGLAVRGE